MSLPGNQTPRQLAAADQQHAAVRAHVNRLISQGQPGGAVPSTEEWVRFAHGPLVDAIDKLAGSKDGAFTAAAVGIAAEALLRLARVGAA